MRRRPELTKLPKVAESSSAGVRLKGGCWLSWSKKVSFCLPGLEAVELVVISDASEDETPVVVEELEGEPGGDAFPPAAAGAAGLLWLEADRMEPERPESGRANIGAVRLP